MRHPACGGRTRTIALLELLGTEVAEAAVAADAVVEDLDVLEDRGPRFGRARPVGAVDQLGLQGGEEALGHGVVVAVADRAHRRRDPGLAQALAEGQARVLGAVVAVVDEVRARAAADDRRVERRGDELGPHVGRHRSSRRPGGSRRRRSRRGSRSPLRVGSSVMSATQSRSGPAAREVAVDEVGNGSACSSRIVVRTKRRRWTPARWSCPHQPGDPLARDVVAGLGEVGVDPGHAVRPPAAGVGAPDLRAPGRRRSAPGRRDPVTRQA